MGATRGRRHSGGGRRRFPIRLIAAVLVSWWGLTGASIESAEAQRLVQVGAAKRTATVTVFIGKSEDVRTDASFTEIAVGDSEIADVNPLTDKSLSILGKKNGTTRVSVYADGKQLIGVFDVEVTYDTSVLASEINRRYPNAGVSVRSVNGRIMLSGTISDAPTLDKIVSIAKQFGGNDIINTVLVLQPQQVMLEVRFIEVQREATRDLGVQWNIFGNRVLANVNANQPAARLPVTRSGGGPFTQPGATVGGPNVGSSALTISPVVAAGVLSGGNPFGFLIGRLIAGGIEIDPMINALEQKGVVRSLAEPNLVALSGDTASFLAGGEYPIPVPGNFGQISVEFKRYGVGLAFTPTVLNNGVINMKVEPEVSELDHNNAVAIGNGISVPALTVRRASTTVELRDGQSFVIGGLLKSGGQNMVQQLPWIGDVPVLGALFRSASYQKNESELAIIVTPRLVRPARPGDAIKTPLDNTVASNDADLFLMGKVEVSRRKAKLIAVREREVEYAGHILELPKGTAYVSVKN